MPRALTVCSTPGCPNTTDRGRCAEHQRRAEQQRGTAAQRGYDSRHRRRFRARVLARDPVCTECHRAPSAHADHHPVDRRTLVARGLDPYDPRHGRGLCHPCHSTHTAHAQPGGWHAR